MSAIFIHFLLRCYFYIYYYTCVNVNLMEQSMKNLFIVLAFLLVSVSVQAQTPYLSGSIADNGYSAINVGADWELESPVNLTTYLGFISNRADREWITAGVGADTEIFTLSGVSVIAGLDGRYIGASSDMGLILSPKAGIAVPVSGSRLSIYTSFDRVFFADASERFSIKNPGINWVPVSLSLSF